MSDIPVQTEFSRNIGILTESQQEKLGTARVAVAGVGGVGGLHVLTLARLGVSRFTIADPDIFEAVNINRQFGATHSSIGRNKAEVLADMVRDLNPQADVRIFPEGVSEANVASFLEDAHFFVDGIDFFEVEIRRLVFRKSREKGIFALTAAPLGFGATLQVFDPAGMSFDDYFGIHDSMRLVEKLAAFAAGLAPTPFHVRYMDFSRVKMSEKTGPAVSPACTLAASLVATEVVRIFCRLSTPRCVPSYLQFDMLCGKFRHGRIIGGGKNPLQQLKKWLILRKLEARQG